MSGGKGMPVPDFEHSFNIDDWMRELLPDDDTQPSQTNRVDRASAVSVPSSSRNNPFQQNAPAAMVEPNHQFAERAAATSVPSSIRNNPVQQNMPAVKVEENYQFAERTVAVSVPSSSRNNPVQQNMPVVKIGEPYQFAATRQQPNMIVSNTSVKQENTSSVTDGPSNPAGVRYPNTPLAGFRGFSQNQTSSVLQLNHQQLQMQHHSPQAVAPSPARLTAYPGNNREQQQPLKNRGTTAPTMRQQQRTVGGQPHSLTLRNQQPMNVVQQPDPTSTDMRRLQLIAQQVRRQQPLQMQAALRQSNSHATSLPTPRNFPSINQIRPENQPQHFLQGSPQASIGSTTQAQAGNSSDWIDQAYLEFQQLKAAHLLEVIGTLKKFTELKNQGPNSQMLLKCHTRLLHIYNFLQSSKEDLLNSGKEKCYHYMNSVRVTLDSLRRRPSGNMQQQPQQVNSSQLQLRTQTQLHQRGNVNPQSHGTSPNLAAPLREARGSTSETSPGSSYQVGSSAGVQKSADTSSMMSSQRYSVMKTTQHHSPTRVSHGSMQIPSPCKTSQLGFEQVSPMLPQTFGATVPQTANLSASQQRVVGMPKNTMNPYDSSISPAGRNYTMEPAEQSPTGDQQMMQKPNRGSPIRHFVRTNRSSSQNKNVSSPQNSQHSSSMLEHSKSRTASPLGFPSPLNPLTPSSKPIDSEKSSLSLEEAFAAPTAMPSPAPTEPASQGLNQSQTELVPDMEELLSSPMVTQSPNADQDESLIDPFQRLLNAVKSMSSQALGASLRDMTAVTKLDDTMTENFYHGKHRMDIFHDLADDTRHCRGWDFPLVETGIESGMRRQMDCIGSWTDMECDDESNSVNMQRTEHKDELLQEIKEANNRLIELVVDASTGHGEGTTIVKCSYCPVGSSWPQTIPYLVLEMIVPAEYPHLPPVVVETQPACCLESEEERDMWSKAMSNFSLALRKMSEPLSVKEMAKAWNACARGVYRDLALCSGGGDFSSMYGSWESCVAASAT